MRSPRPRTRTRARTRWFKEDVVAWGVFLAIVAAAIFGTHYWLNRRVVDAGVSAADGVDDPEIVALAFDRVVTEPEEGKVDAGLLRSYLVGLRDAGFVPVTLRALAAFYERGRPLPPRSLLLSFDHGYLSTYAAVDPVLRELGWNAVLFVMTERQSRRDPFFVYWDRLEHMRSSGVWELGSHGHHGHDPIPVDAAGNEGPFFIRKRWLEPQGRVESWDEFEVRVAADHRRAKHLLEERLGNEVLAYAPPLRDVAGLSDAPEAHRVTEAILRATYRLVFHDDRFGVNDGRTDPHRLKRLRVQPRWSARELVSRVELALGEPRDTGLGRSPWLAGSGEVRPDGDELVVTGERRADVWRAGSQSAEDWELDVRFRVEGGELWVVQESDDGFEEWRFGGTAERTYVQLRRAGERTEVLQSFDRGIEPGLWHRLRLAKRGLGLTAELDGEAVSELPTLLPGRFRGGVGVVHWKDEGATPELRLRKPRFAAIPFRARVLSSELTTGELQGAIAEARSLPAVAPRIFELASGRLTRRPVDETLLSMLSQRFGWEVVPTVRLLDVEPATLGALATLIASDDYDGLRVELAPGDAESRQRVSRLLAEAGGRADLRPGRLFLSEPRKDPPKEARR